MAGRIFLGWGCSSVIEYLPRMYEGLDSILATPHPGHTTDLDAAEASQTRGKAVCKQR
jgi:hypothetical protein